MSSELLTMTSLGSTLTAPSVSPQHRTQPLSEEDHVQVQAETTMLRRLIDALAGKYELLGRLGEGGMGVVYLARDLALGRRVAIKVMLPEHVTSPGTSERFRREARTVASLNHPNIIPVYAVHEADDLAYFVMRYVEGRTLNSILRLGGRLPPPIAQAVLGQVGRGLAYAHRHGVVHRDIKPANIMIDEDGWVLIADFGIAKVRDTHDLTLAGTTIGTPRYMSPEQCSDHDVSPASDQYALGIVAYEVLSGRVPFDGKTIASVVKQQLFDSPVPLEEVYPECPSPLAQAVNRMLAKLPEERWPSVEEAMRKVSGAIPVDGEEVRAAIAAASRPGRVPTVTLLPTTTSPVGPARASATVVLPLLRHRSRRNRLIVGTVGTAMLAIAVFVPGKGRIASDQRTPAQGAPADSAFLQATDSTARRNDTPPAAYATAAPMIDSAHRRSPRTHKRRQDELTTFGATAAPRLGSMLLGTRGLPAVLYVDDAPRGAVSGLRSWPLSAGTVRISIRLEGCVSWDSTVVIEPGNELRVGYRSPQCPS